MSKQELKKTVADLKTALDKAQADLAELNRPKLRHGDYGQWDTGQAWLVLRRLAVLEAFGISSGVGTKAPMGIPETPIVLGNFFDDIKIMTKKEKKPC